MNKTIITIFLASIMLVGCRKTAKIATSSMQPTILKNEKVEIDLDAYESTNPKRWDIVAFMLPQMPGFEDKLYVKRIIGLPGEIIEMKDGFLLIDRQAIPIPKYLSFLNFIAIQQDSQYGKPIAFPLTIPEDKYFVFADSPKGGLDSRMHGPITRTKIIGKIKNKK